MNSLVGYGVSSESDSDAEDSNVAEDRGTSVDACTSTVKRSRNFLLEADSASSGSDGEADPHEDLKPPASLKRPSAPQQTSLPPPFQSHVLPNKLPSPVLSASSDSSVFANPFKAQAEQKLSALQKHVPLTMQPKPSQIGGKRICVSYRKDGRCRFGIKCKFAHDSDIQTVAATSDAASSMNQTTQETSSEAAGSHQMEVDTQQARKRKAGLSNTLIPPKRAMKQFAIQRDRERLHMS